MALPHGREGWQWGGSGQKEEADSLLPAGCLERTSWGMSTGTRGHPSAPSRG